MAAVDLRPGWNLITRTIDQKLRSFLVYSGESRGNYGKKAKY
jgi:hypothetical protein